MKPRKPGVKIKLPGPKPGLVSGAQTRPTKAVKSFVAQFPGKPSPEMAEEIVRAVRRRVRREKLSWNEFSKYYSRRTASQILESGKAFALDKKRGIIESTGCADHSLAITAALRAKGIPAFFARIGTHSVALTRLNGRWFVADPSARQPVKELSKGMKAEIAVLKKHGRFAMGKDAWNIGIKGIKDFGKYL